MKLHTCIWYNNNAQEAVKLYQEAFGDVTVLSDSGMVVMFNIKGTPIMALNGGELNAPTPALSYYVSCADAGEAEKAWNVLAREGKALMPLGKYDWNEQFGWIADKYGVNWQLWTGDFSQPAQKVVPGLMFCGPVQGRAAEAISFYTALFQNASEGMMARYPADAPGIGGQVMHAEFTLEDVLFKAFDSGVPQPFTFSPGVSVVIHCDSQEEIDHFWNRFTQDGGREDHCGWCQDKFGVSWQVIPTILPTLMADPEKGPRVMQAFLKMKKFDIQGLLDA